VQTEVPGPEGGPVQWERHVAHKYVELRLDKCFRTDETAKNDDGGGGGRPDTLILTSLPGYGGRDTAATARRLCFVNVQRHLRQRGVELRQQFPDVHRKLREYADGDADVTFTPVTVYPRDRDTGKTFMCVIMPDTEPERSFVGGATAAQIVDVARDSADRP